jgi:excisionase family DNA binding protein
MSTQFACVGRNVAFSSEPAVTTVVGSTPSDCQTNSAASLVGLAPNRLSIPEIAKHLSIGRLAVYAMLEQGMLPGVRLGRRWIVTRSAYEQWERTCGTTGFQRHVGGSV